MMTVEKIMEILRGEILNGTLAPGQKLPSEYELAERFAVNKKSANKAVSILAAQGYITRGKRGQNTLVASTLPFPKGIFLFIGPYRFSAYSGGILKGMQNTALQSNYLTSWISPPIHELKNVLRNLTNSTVKGVVSFTYGTFQTSVPHIYVDEPEQNLAPEDHLISCDNYNGAYSMMQTVIRRGHREIVVCFNTCLMNSRLDGFRQAMLDHGITDVDSRIFASPGLCSENGEALAFLRKVRKRFPRCTAIVCGSDHQMYYLSHALDKTEPQWRNTMALTGFGNLYNEENFLPVASVDQHPETIGSLIVEHLISLTENGRECVQPIRENTDFELVNISNIPILAH